MIRLILLAILAVSLTPAWGAAISAGTWYCAWWDEGEPAPWGACGSGEGFFGEAGTPIERVGDAPFTISLTAPAYLIVVDAYYTGDQFEVFNFGTSIGFTSLPSDPDETGCVGGNDPVTCLLDSRYSSGYFLLGAGDHEITISTTTNPWDEGAAFFGVFPESEVPEPGSFALLGGGLAAVALVRRRK